jgi:hypothetical protein
MTKCLDARNDFDTPGWVAQVSLTPTGTELIAQGNRPQCEGVVVDLSKLSLRVRTTKVAKEGFAFDLIGVFAIKLLVHWGSASRGRGAKSGKTYLQNVSSHERQLTEEELDGRDEQYAVTRAVNHDSVHRRIQDQHPLAQFERSRTHPTLSNKHCSFLLRSRPTFPLHRMPLSSSRTSDVSSPPPPPSLECDMSSASGASGCLKVDSPRLIAKTCPRPRYAAAVVKQ